MANVEVKNLSYTPVSISAESKKGSISLGARSCQKIDEKLLESAEGRRLLAERKLAVLQPRQAKPEEEKEPDKPRSNRSGRSRSKRSKGEAKDS